MRTIIAVPGHVARGLVATSFAILSYGTLAPAARAQNDKPPYELIYFEGGGGVWIPQHSTASVPTQTCSNGLIPSLSQPCAEQFSKTGAGLIGMGVRPIRYLEAGLTGGILGDFNGYKSITAPYQCVSGCTGTLSETINTTTALVALEARGVLPLFHEHLLLSGGGGVGWVEVRSHAQTGSAGVIGGCAYCPSPQGGHGPSEVGEVTYLPNKHFGLGLEFRHVGISSSGLSSTAGPLLGPPVTYKDHFLLIGGVISVRFGDRKH